MNRITQTFAAARQQNRKLLCPFLTAGYPSLDATPQLLLACQNAGAGMIELGIPFSDPIADGPTIQESYTHALAHGATVDKALACVTAARKLGVTIPVVAMVSFSIIFKRGTEAFAKSCRDHDLDGLILPDIPLEEAPAIVNAVAKAGLLSSLLVAPTSPPERRAAIAKLCDGFIYYLSVSGITGERKALPTDIAPNLEALRKVTTTPICVGFGISTRDQVHEITRIADGAIVGSALVRRLTATLDAGLPAQLAAASTFITDLAQGL